MAGEAALGRAVLELSTDGKQLDAGLADVPKKVKKTGEAAKEAAGDFEKMNGLLEKLGIGLSIGAVVEFGKSILDLADNIVKVSDRTGLTTDEVQRLQFIAEQSGNSIDDLTGAVSKLQVRLSDGSARKGIEDLGLNFEKIRNLRPADALAEIAQKIGAIENPALRAQAAVAIFGKSGTEIIPTLLANFKELGDQAPVMSEATVRALDQAGDAFGRFGAQLKVWAADSYLSIGKAFDKLIAGVYRGIAEVIDGISKLVGLAAKIPGADKIGITKGLSASLKDQSVWFTDAAKGLETFTAAAVAVKPPLAALPPLHKEATQAAKDHAKAIADLIEKLGGAGAIKAATDLREALAKLPPIQRLTKESQLEIAKTMEAAIAVYQAAGVSIPRDLQLIAMAARAASQTVNDATKLQIETMQKAWAQIGGIKLASVPVAFGFEDPTWATRETLKATRSFAGIVGQVDTKAVGAAAAQRMKNAFGPNFWQQTFGSAANFGANLGNAISGAIQGGGNVFNAAGGMIGQQLGASIAGKLGESLLKKGAGVLSKALGGLLETVLPGVGALLGPLLGKAWDGIKKLFGGGNDGRKLVEQFISGTFGSSSELQRQLLELGPEYDRLWRGLTQLGDNASAAEAQSAIDAVTEALAKQKAKVAEAAAGSVAAAEDVAAAQATAADEIRGRYADAFKAIDDEYKKLQDSVAAEAEEADMGAQERLDRARMAELADQAAALKAKQDAEIAANQETFGAVVEAGKETRTELEKIFGGSTLKIPFEFVSAGGLPEPIPMAGGGFGRVTRPTLFYSRGDEDYAFSGEGRSFGLGKLASRPIEITNVTELDGRVTSRNMIRHTPNELARVGIRSR